MKKISIIVMLACIIVSANAQNEIYISVDSARTTSIKGISLCMTGKKYFTSRINFRTQYDANYFYEKSIFKPATMLFYGGLSYYQIQKEDYHWDASGYSSGTGLDTYNSNYLLFSLSIEPRYYFSLNKRISERRGGLNSGWFIGLPLSFSFILNNPENYYHNVKNELVNIDLSLKDHFRYSAGLNMGYRYAITNKLFGEAVLGLNYINCNDYYEDEYHLSLYGKLLIGYTF